MLSGILFVSMHWPHRIWRDGWTGSVFADAPALLLIALALGYDVEAALEGFDP